MRKRKHRSKKTGPQPYIYFFRVRQWYVRCRNNYEWKILRERNDNARPFEGGEIRETNIAHSHYLKIEAELLNPVKKVISGSINFLSARKVRKKTAVFPKHIQYEERHHEDGGGCLWSRWDEEKINRVCTGLVHVDECSFLSMVQVLTSGCKVIIDLGGNEFFRNDALIRSVGWFTEGEPDLMDEVEWAVEKSKTRKC